MGAIVNIISLLVGLFTRGDNLTEKTAGGFSGIALLGGAVGVASWLLGPGKEFTVTLDAMEMGFILLLGFVVAEVMYRMTPPK